MRRPRQVGVREVTLIGQNVNSYARRHRLRRAAAARRARSRASCGSASPPATRTTSPTRLVEAFRDEPQDRRRTSTCRCSAARTRCSSGCGATTPWRSTSSGSRSSRAARPGIAVTTDIIVGFPGETEDDFEATLALTEQVRYENQFSFVFSPRPQHGRRAQGGGVGAVPHEVKVAAARAAAEAAADGSAVRSPPSWSAGGRGAGRGAFPIRPDRAASAARREPHRELRRDAPGRRTARVRITHGSPSAALLGVSRRRASVDLPQAFRRSSRGPRPLDRESVLSRASPRGCTPRSSSPTARRSSGTWRSGRNPRSGSTPCSAAT